MKTRELLLGLLFVLFFCSLGYGRCLEGNCIDGKGKIWLEEGFLYTGYFYNSLPHGKGIVQSKDGARLIGYWRHGSLHGKVIITIKEGNRLHCNFTNGQVDGVGYLLGKDGNKIARYEWSEGDLIASQSLIDNPTINDNLHNDGTDQLLTINEHKSITRMGNQIEASHYITIRDQYNRAWLRGETFTSDGEQHTITEIEGLFLDEDHFSIEINTESEIKVREQQTEGFNNQAANLNASPVKNL